jgi:hypothetical protein
MFHSLISSVVDMADVGRVSPSRAVPAGMGPKGQGMACRRLIFGHGGNDTYTYLSVEKLRKWLSGVFLCPFLAVRASEICLSGPDRRRILEVLIAQV